MGVIPNPADAADEDWSVDHRFRAVVEVLDGAPVAEVARRDVAAVPARLAAPLFARADGTARWTARVGRHTSPSRVPLDVELVICQLRQT